MLSGMDVSGPVEIHAERVQPGWIDYNGHMNVAYYFLVFDHATDALLDHVGIDEAYRRRTGCSVFTLEGHITYEREVKEGDPLRITTQVLDHDARFLHYFHRMYHADEEYLAATNELLILHVDLAGPKGVPVPEEVHGRIAEIADAHASLPVPDQAGRRIRIRRK